LGQPVATPAEIAVGLKTGSHNLGLGKKLEQF
jgi:hypothetical protein